MRSLASGDRQALFPVPIADGIAMDAEHGGRLIDGVAPERFDPSPVGALATPLHGYDARSMRVRMSSTRQAVIRGPSFTGLGKRPDFTPTMWIC